MRQILESIYRERFLVCVCLLLCACYYFAFVDRALVTLTIDVEKKTFFRIYWAEPGEQFSVQNHARVLVRPGEHSYSFYLTDLKGVERLRIDPQEYTGRSEMRRLVISQKGLRDIDLGKEHYSSMQPAGHIENSVISGDELVTVSNGKDPQYEYVVTTYPVAFGWPGEAVRLLFLFAALFLGGKGVAPLLLRERYVPFLLAGVVALALSMALLSERDVHPDEYVHLAAAQYYTDNWLPPVVESDEIADTYSRYGVSRLNGREIYYFIAGKFNALLTNVHLPEFVSLRLFNIMLLTVILTVAVRYAASRLVVAALLVSPQLWYVFSYCNSDAFAVCIGLLAGWQVVDRDSHLYRYLEGSENEIWPKVRAVIGLGLLFGLLLLVKKNYYPLAAFLAFVTLVRLKGRLHEINGRDCLVRILTLGMVAIAIVGARICTDIYVNGFDRAEKIRNIRTELAEPMFNPATPLNKRHVQLSMKERGVTLSRIIHEHRWFEKTFRSGFGVYGYFTVSATHVLYDLFRWCSLALLLFLVVSVMVKGNWPERLIMVAGLFLSLLLVAVSIHHSWTNDFQAQGRYLFPVAVMLAVSAATAAQTLHRKSLCMLVAALYTLSGYSFILYGLKELG